MKTKRKVVRPWGRKLKGGVLLSWDGVEAILKEGEALEYKGISVGTKNLLKLVRLMREDNTDVLVSANGTLNFELRARKSVKTNGHRRIASVKPRFRKEISLVKGAWLRRIVPASVVVLRPTVN